MAGRVPFPKRFDVARERAARPFLRLARMHRYVTVGGAILALVMLGLCVMALYEGRIMDAELGVMVNPAFNDYKLVGAMEIPELIPIIDDGDTRDVVIGIAEPGNIPGCGAVANAVYNACGVRVRETPITPDKILNGMMEMRRNA